MALPPLCAVSEGYNLHAGVSVGASRRSKLERLCRYEVRVNPQARQRAREYLARVTGEEPSADGHFNVALIHYQGNSARRNKNTAEAVKAFKALNFNVIAAGDSYNDTAMLVEANAGIFFRPPQNVIDEFPQFPVTRDYDALRAAFTRAAASL